MNPDDLTPHEGVPRRIVAGPGLTPKELRRREKHHSQIEKWKAEAVAGEAMSRGNRVRLAVGVGCAALIAACLYVPAIGLREDSFVLERRWVWIWEAPTIDGAFLAIQVGVVVALTAIAALLSSRD